MLHLVDRDVYGRGVDDGLQRRLLVDGEQVPSEVLCEELEDLYESMGRERRLPRVFLVIADKRVLRENRVQAVVKLLLAERDGLQRARVSQRRQRRVRIEHHVEQRRASARMQTRPAPLLHTCDPRPFIIHFDYLLSSYMRLIYALLCAFSCRSLTSFSSHVTSTTMLRTGVHTLIF